MKTHWTCYYLDGVTAKKHPAVVDITPRELIVKVESGESLHWPHEELTQTLGFYRDEPVRIERGRDPIEAVVIEKDVDKTGEKSGQGAEFLRVLRAVAGAHASRYHDPTLRRRRASYAAVAAVTSVAIIALFYFRGIPWIADLAAENVPPSWEASLGEGVKNNFTTLFDICEDEAATKAVAEIFAPLVAAAGQIPYDFEITIVDADVVNALAAPGGYIIIFSGLMEKTETPEDLAGVLAHEMVHVLQKHSLKGLFRQFTTQMLLAAVFGDASAVSSTIGSLDSMHYGRGYEEEADLLGTELLVEAKIDPAGMIRFFETLSEEMGDEREEFRYFSSHPLTSERIQTLTDASKSRRASYAPLLPDMDWSVVSKACGEEQLPPIRK